MRQITAHRRQMTLECIQVLRRNLHNASTPPYPEGFGLQAQTVRTSVHAHPREEQQGLPKAGNLGDAVLIGPLSKDLLLLKS